MQLTSFYCRIIERELSRSLADLTDLYKGTNLSHSYVHEVAHVDIQQFRIFLGNALSISENPAFGLIVGANTRLAGFGEMGVAALAAPTILEGLQVMETYSHLHSGLSKLLLFVNSKGLKLSVQHYTVDEFSTIYSEVFALFVQNYLEEVLGAQFTQGQYQFSHNCPSYHHQYKKLMHAPVKFSCRETAVVLPRALVQEKSPYYDAGLWRYSLQQCANQLAKMCDDEQTTYTSHVSNQLRSQYLPLPPLKIIARKLCVSERSLSRKLQEEGTNYRQLSKAELMSRACDLIQNTTMSIDAIAAQMGYLDNANFRRAFKSRVQCSPSVYREQTRG